MLTLFIVIQVVQQIDRLTANIDLSEETPSITQGSSNNFHGSAHLVDLRVAPLPNHKPAAAQVSQHADEDRIILRTNSPSPVHIASVVKTSCFTPPGHSKDINHERPGVNGHLPHMCPPRDSSHTGQTPPEPHPQSLDPKVIIGNSTSNSKTHKPPPYPQNGRCGKGLYPPPKPLKTPANPGRGRQSTSMVWRRGGGLPQCHGGLKHETLLQQMEVKERPGRGTTHGKFGYKTTFSLLLTFLSALGADDVCCVYWQRSFQSQ